jgi:hypothetical protein
MCTATAWSHLVSHELSGFSSRRSTSSHLAFLATADPSPTSSRAGSLDLGPTPYFRSMVPDDSHLILRGWVSPQRILMTAADLNNVRQL